jgi:hypothetical protein
VAARTTCGREATTFFYSSSCLAKFFCLMRRACRLWADSTLRAAEMWKECNVDDDADVNVAAAALEAAETE